MSHSHSNIYVQQGTPCTVSYKWRMLFNNSCWEPLNNELAQNAQVIGENSEVISTSAPPFNPLTKEIIELVSS